MLVVGLKNVKRRITKFIADMKFYRALCILESREAQFALSQENRVEKVVVSLTSYGKRLETVHIAIKSMLCQTYPPDKIILYLAEDVKKNDIPESILELTQFGLEIKFKSGNLGPHKKYYYAMLDYPEDLIITIDDDLLYPEYLLEELVKEHQKYPNAVIAARIHEIRFDNNGDILPYTKWGYEYNGAKCVPKYKFLATGGAGTLYPPGAIDESFFNQKLILELSYRTDDLWLKIGELKAGVPVKMASAKIWKNTYELPSAIDNALSNENVYGGVNDINMKKIMEYFHLRAEDFYDNTFEEDN